MGQGLKGRQNCGRQVTWWGRGGERAGKPPTGKAGEWAWVQVRWWKAGLEGGRNSSEEGQGMGGAGNVGNGIEELKEAVSQAGTEGWKARQVGGVRHILGME